MPCVGVLANTQSHSHDVHTGNMYTYCTHKQVHELQALRQQLEPEVDIPQLQPLRDEVERLDALLAALQQLQVCGGGVC